MICIVCKQKQNEHMYVCIRLLDRVISLQTYLVISISLKKIVHIYTIINFNAAIDRKTVESQKIFFCIRYNIQLKFKYLIKLVEFVFLSIFSELLRYYQIINVS